MKDLFTARGLIIRASVFVLLFAVAHAAGLRSYTSMLSATIPDGDGPTYLKAFLAAAYIMTYLLAVVLSPILLIAATLLHLTTKPKTTGSSLNI